MNLRQGTGPRSFAVAVEAHLEVAANTLAVAVVERQVVGG